MATAAALSATATTKAARASARWADSGSRRSTPKRHTGPTEPATSATVVRPTPRTPRLPANGPATMASVPAAVPQSIEK